ncbi:hypothetical protein QBC46DRAFT_383737 [Diplogelasinospora grovesii]|uniref:Uncharacterized protein n=1 Tax=Diplogelasinospora grovesii TaxID=303347 RepID=A0AAN6N8H6_9PEZI|nr:hypothetical protein QBC46DRAFT_383737 [Diplogelasinospora grovesii]
MPSASDAIDDGSEYGNGFGGYETTGREKAGSPAQDVSESYPVHLPAADDEPINAILAQVGEHDPHLLSLNREILIQTQVGLYIHTPALSRSLNGCRLQTMDESVAVADRIGREIVGAYEEEGTRILNDLRARREEEIRELEAAQASVNAAMRDTFERAGIEMTDLTEQLESIDLDAILAQVRAKESKVLQQLAADKRVLEKELKEVDEWELQQLAEWEGPEGPVIEVNSDDSDFDEWEDEDDEDIHVDRKAIDEMKERLYKRMGQTGLKTTEPAEGQREAEQLLEQTMEKIAARREEREERHKAWDCKAWGCKEHGHSNDGDEEMEDAGPSVEEPTESGGLDGDSVGEWLMSLRFGPASE